MDDTFLRYYENELDSLRRSSRRFAAEFPKVARRLQLGEGECADPYVERLLEGVAFLTARISRKLDDAQAEFPETLLDQIAPEYNAPTPSRGVIRISPQENCHALPKGAAFHVRTTLPERQVCTYTLREDVVFPGIEVRATEYDDAIARKAAAHIGAEAAGSIKLTLSCSRGSGSDVRFFASMPEAAAGELLRLIMTECSGILIYHGEQELHLPPSCLADDPPPDDAIALPPTAEYFLLPEQMAFITIRGLREALPSEGEATVHLLLRRPPSDRLRLLMLAAPALITNCARVINAFPHRLSRVIPSWRAAEHLVADATAADDYEILQVYDGAAYNENNAKLFDLYPFYLATDRAIPTGEERLNYYSTHREAPAAPVRQRMSSYTGSELYLRISGPGYSAQRDSIRSIALQALCSNRDLPLFVRQDTPLEHGEKCRAGFIAGPTAPTAPLMQSAARYMGLALARLTPSTLAAYGDDSLPGILQTLLSHQHQAENLTAGKQALGITAARAKAVTRTIPVQGDLCVMRGWAFDITLNENASGGSSVYLFAGSLAAFLLSLAELNTFLEVTIRTTTHPLRTWQHLPTNS